MSPSSSVSLSALNALLVVLAPRFQHPPNLAFCCDLVFVRQQWRPALAWSRAALLIGPACGRASRLHLNSMSIEVLGHGKRSSFASGSSWTDLTKVTVNSVERGLAAAPPDSSSRRANARPEVSQKSVTHQCLVLPQPRPWPDPNACRRHYGHRQQAAHHQ